MGKRTGRWEGKAEITKGNFKWTEVGQLQVLSVFRHGCIYVEWKNTMQKLVCRSYEHEAGRITAKDDVGRSQWKGGS